MTQNPSLLVTPQEIDAINPNTSPSFRRVSLRNRLLSLILPTVLGTVTLSGFLGYRFLVQEKAQAEIKQQLVDEVALAGETIEQKLVEAVRLTELIAANSDTLNAVINSQQKVKQDKLDRLSISELEEKFATNKLLTPNEQLNKYLQKIVEISGLEEVFYTDRNGFNIAYSEPTSDFVQRDETWWQKGKSETKWLSSPKFDDSANTVGFELAQAITDPKTGEFLGVIKAILPGSYFDVVADNLSHLRIDESQIFQFIAPGDNKVIQTIKYQGLSNNLDLIGGSEITEIAALLIEPQINSQELLKTLQQKNYLKDVNVEFYNAKKNIVVVSFIYQKKYYTLMPIPNQDLVAVASIDKLALQTAGGELLPILFPIALVLIISLTIIIIVVTNKLSQPLVDLATTAEQAAIGNLDVVAKPQGTLETQTLAYSFNNLIFQVNKLIKQQQEEAQQAKKTQDIILKINNLQDSQLIIKTVVQEIRSVLSVERVIYYKFDEQFIGKTQVESLAQGNTSTIGETIYTPNWLQEYIAQNSNQVQVINDIRQANLSKEQLQQLQSFGVQASLIIPIFIQGKPIALLVTHQCFRPRNWQPQEISFVEQIANQLGFVLERLEFLEQQKNAEIQAKQAQEQLQWRAIELLQEVDPISQGDLTIRAKVTQDEIGTIADSYNAAIASLQKLVNQVKTVAKDVETTADNSKNIVEKLAQESVEQAESIFQTVAYIQEIDSSIRSVSERASQAQEIVKKAGQTIDIGDHATNQAVLKINILQKTVTETEQKVKRLGESSQEISQVLDSISSFAAQTHLLALKASIEAARAGEQGKGFAVIADEVRSLASQSATATADIENFVAKIQLETTEVVKAMSSGTQQVVEGTELVEQTRQSLDSVTAASNEIQKLVTEIAESALQQLETSNLVSKNIAHVAATAQENSQSATQVSEEIQQLLTVAGKLQTGIDKFKT
ncbi:MAG: methyl-accepting chemotaxis protein [Xenococcaceae cyanobacterium MO_167.B27]|nr:methyl-accepting chemotaxis protein [Xenococcaceae cyanobacterium MO_167.B27]